MIPLSSVDLPEEALELVGRVLESGMLAQGPMVKRFEADFAALVGVRHAVAVNSGTTALIAALQALDLEPGDEVLTSPFTFVATLNAILEAGATAVFADISADDFCIDPQALRAAITPRTRVLMPVHLYGQCADMTAVESIAGQHGLHIVEDAAQAHAASIDGRRAGSFGLGCFSFYATKNITTGEGGMITTDDAIFADRLRILRNQGMRERYSYELAGHNYRLTDLQAALAIPQLAVIDRTIARRRANAARLTAALADVPGLALPRQLPGRDHVWHQFTVLITGRAPIERDEFVAKLAERGVGSGVYYPRPVFDHDCFRSNPQVKLSDTPVAASVAKRVVSLPVHPKLSLAEIDTIVAATRDLMKV